MHADVAPELALQADAVGRNLGGAAGRKALITSRSWRLLMGQPLSSKSTLTWAGDGRGLLQGLDVFRMGIDRRDEVVDVREVAQGLDAPGAGAGADGHQEFGEPGAPF